MAIWTVDTWRVVPGRESSFLKGCARLSPDRLVLYRDVEDESLFWSPAKWDDIETLQDWRDGDQYGAALAALEGDIMEHHTHLMTEVPGFPPRSADAPGRGRAGP